MFGKNGIESEDFLNLLDGSMEESELESMNDFISMDDDSGSDAKNMNLDDFEDMGTTLEESDISSKGKRKSKSGKSLIFKGKMNTKIKSKIKPKRKRKGKNETFIEMGVVGSSAIEDDFVIVGEGSKKFRNLKTTFRITFGIIGFIALTIIAYLAMSFKVIPENIKGSTYSAYGFNVISRNYQANLDELKFGDGIICMDEKLDWLPIIVNYRKLTFKSRNGAIIFAEDESGISHKIQSVEIDYIIKGDD